MAYVLPYGKSESLVFRFREDLRVTDTAVPRGSPVEDVERAVLEALQSPLEFPALSLSVVAGDRIAIPLGLGVPQGPSVVAGVVRALVESGVPLTNIALVTAGKPKPEGKAKSEKAKAEKSEEGEVASRWVSELPEAWRSELKVVTHDPTDSESMAYLAASPEADPIYINRVLSDADLVIPIGTARTRSPVKRPAMFDSLYPLFSDSATQKRFRVSGRVKWKTYAEQRFEEVQNAGWWLGVQMMLQVVPGPGDSVLQVLAGQCAEVFQESQRLAQAAWQVKVPDRAGVVVAGISGGSEQQTWENVARALYAAAKLVKDQGAIVLCTQLRGKPGPMVQLLRDWSAGDAVPPIVRRDRTTDAVAALALMRVRQRARVYLMSGMKSDLVEDLGLGYVESVEEIERLTRHQEQCVLLPGAQYAEVVTLDE